MSAKAIEVRLEKKCICKAVWVGEGFRDSHLLSCPQRYLLNVVMGWVGQGLCFTEKAQS